MYPEGLQGVFNKEIDFDTDNFRMVLVSSAYTYNAAHEDHADLTGIIATSASFQCDITTIPGSIDCPDVTFTTVAGGSTVAAYIIYHWTGVSATSKLIQYIDSASELPFATNGGDITVNINASGFYKGD